MALTFYRNQSHANVVDKVLSDAKTINGERLVDDIFNEANPSIKVYGIKDFSTYNYFKYADKYYFMNPNSVNWITNDVAVITGHIDVLTTFKDLVRSLECYVDRSNTPQPYVSDELDTFTCYQNSEVISFKKGFGELEEDGVYIFMTAQAGYTLPG